MLALVQKVPVKTYPGFSVDKDAECPYYLAVIEHEPDVVKRALG